jgi:hypothetical protein
MNKGHDYILSLLVGEKYGGHHIESIPREFELAGYGSAQPYLDALVDEAYIDVMPNKEPFYRLNDKGEEVYTNGGFVRWKLRAAQGRIALTMTIIAIISMAGIAWAVLYSR